VAKAATAINTSGVIAYVMGSTGEISKSCDRSRRVNNKAHADGQSGRRQYQTLAHQHPLHAGGGRA